MQEQPNAKRILHETEGDVAQPTDWLTRKEAARHVKVSETTIARETKAGRLKGFRVGGRRSWRFRLQDVEAWLVGGVSATD